MIKIFIKSFLTISIILFSFELYSQKLSEKEFAERLNYVNEVKGEANVGIRRERTPEERVSLILGKVRYFRFHGTPLPTSGR